MCVFVCVPISSYPKFSIVKSESDSEPEERWVEAPSAVQVQSTDSTHKRSLARTHTPSLCFSRLSDYIYILAPPIILKDLCS